MTYPLLILGICISAVFSRKIVSRQRKIFYISLFCFLCWIVMAFRSVEVGVDTKNYMNMFNTVSNLQLKEIFQSASYHDKMGYILCMKLCSVFINNYYFFQVVVSLLFCIHFSRFLIRNSKDLFLTTIIFISSGLYLGAFNISRQALAGAFCLSAWENFRENKRINAVFWLVVASLTHFTSIIFLLAFIVYEIRHNKRLIKLAVGVMLIMAINYKAIISVVSRYVTIYYNYYSNTKTLQNASAGLVTIVWAIIAVFSIYIICKRKSDDNVDRVNALFSLAFVITNVIGMYFNYFERIGLFFQPFSILIFDTVGNGIKNKSVRGIYRWGVIICFVIYFFISGTSKQYIYNTFLFDMGG